MTPTFKDKEEKDDFNDAKRGVDKTDGMDEMRSKGLKLVKNLIAEHLDEYAEGEMDWDECLESMMEDLKACDPDEYTEGGDEEQPKE